MVLCEHVFANNVNIVDCELETKMSDFGNVDHILAMDVENDCSVMPSISDGLSATFDQCSSNDSDDNIVTNDPNDAALHIDIEKCENQLSDSDSDSDYSFIDNMLEQRVNVESLKRQSCKRKLTD